MIQYDWISKWAEYFPHKTAIKEYETDRELTYSQLNNLANYFAKKFISDFRIKTGDRLVILAENSLEHVILFSVAQKIGITIVPLNYRLTPVEIDYQLNDCEPEIILTESKYYEKVRGLDSFKKIRVKLSLEEFTNEISSVSEQFFDFEDLDLNLEDLPIFILYTSGTTGNPKGALYTHKMLFWNSINTCLRLDITSSDKSISCTPMFHTGGWNVILTPFLHHGAFVCLTKKFDADLILKLLNEYKATMFMAVPTMLSIMAQSELFDLVDLSSVKFFVVGGEPMPLPLIELWHKKGVPIRQGYGLTEVGPSVTSLHQDDAMRKIGSIGKVNFYLRYKILNDENEKVKKGEVGELVLKGPSVTIGYWRNEEETRNSLKDGWFYTGDLVREDDEGYLYIVDRKKNMFISGGENVYPAEIEKVLYKHQAIKEVAVIGVPDEKWGEVGKAYIVLKEGFNLTIDDLTNFCGGYLAKYKIPKHVEFVSELPKNETGKIDKKLLLKMHLNSISQTK